LRRQDHLGRRRAVLGASDRAIGLIVRLAGCFTDSRSPEQVEHTVATLVGQRIFCIALGYENVLDTTNCAMTRLMAVLAGKLAARRKNWAPVAGESTLNRLELGKPRPTPYQKIGHDPQAIEALLVELFLDTHETAKWDQTACSHRLGGTAIPAA
jgi:hypothetical protein